MLPTQIRAQLATDRQAEIARVAARPRHGAPRAGRAGRPAFAARLLGRTAAVTT